MKFGLIAGAQNVLIFNTKFNTKCVSDTKFNTKCVSEARQVSSANGRVQDDEFRFGSWSTRPRIVNDPASVFGKFLLDLRVQFWKQRLICDADKS